MYINDIVVHIFFLNVIYHLSGAASDVKVDTLSTETCLAHVTACEENAGGSRKAVCGTDGRTYPSRCDLMKAQCSGESVAVARRGPCLEGQSSCLIALRYALNVHGGQRPAFVPRCRADGTYAPVQCAAAAGCWCVTPDGKTFPDTSVRNGRPDCTRTGKSHTRRRSSVRGQRNKRSCSRADRTQFNANLIKIFNGEMERGRGAEGGAAAEPRAVADWKFRELDRDRSGALQKSEYRGLRRLIKKVVKPKRCARAWARGCDANADGAIARAEWAACLLASPEPPAPDYDDGGPEPEPDYTEEEPPSDPSAVLPGIMRNSFAPDGSDNRREDEINDCLTDRQAVLDEQVCDYALEKSHIIGGAVLYVPECTGDGRYARAQCYKTTGYCWCVHQDTGKPIPGSSVKDRRPNCDAAPQHASPMRGCPEPIKSNFLRDLMSFFITKMTAASNGTGPGELVKWGASKEEQAATWTYVVLDKDKNKVLDRREWKAFHQLINNVEPLRRCGRKLPRYCDVNHDTRISITEWMACLEVNQATQAHTANAEALKPPANPRRKGPNPLESILKADD